MADIQDEMPPMVELTKLETLHIINTLRDMQAEIGACDESEYVFTTGVEEGIKESLQILKAAMRHAK